MPESMCINSLVFSARFFESVMWVKGCPIAPSAAMEVGDDAIV